MTELTDLSRRSFLSATAGLFAWSFAPRIASAARSRDSRFLTIILRGGLDGLSAVPPVGDPDYLRLRPRIALSLEGPNPALPLEGAFALNGQFANLHRLYRAREAVVLQAVATPYRERSHFDGQDVLETGLGGVGGRTGWLNRALSVLPAGDKLKVPNGLAVGQTTPLILAGPADITSWAPQRYPDATDDTVHRLLALYEARDPELAKALATGVATDRVADAATGGGAKLERGPQGVFVAQARAAAQFMAMPDGPRIAAMSFDGWDTHADTGPRDGRLARLLGGLDAAIGALEEGMKSVWKDTVIQIVTEFGRTAHENGTDGTDHGTATVAFLIGGAVVGGRVIADWPSLAEGSLWQGRDLKPTIDLRSIWKGVLVDHLGLGERTINETVFPGSAAVHAMRGLIRA